MTNCLTAHSRTRTVSATALVAGAIAFSLASRLPAQTPAPRDTAARDTTTRDTTARTNSTARRDSLARRATRLATVTVTATPVRRNEPQSAITVSPTVIALTPATSPWDLLRQSAGVEVHLQGQGPGFASDASVRGFSSDHSTDLALWIDGVPINEPVNGHAEGYNDWGLIFPSAVQSIDVIKGPTSALFGNFALSGIVNVHTLERMQGTEATIDAGNAGHIDATVLTGFDHGPAGGGVFGARWGHEDGWRPNSSSNVEQGHFRVVHDLDSTWRIDGGVELYGADWKSPGFLSEDEFARRDYDIVSNPTDGGNKYHAQERVSFRYLAGPLLWRTTLYSTQGNWKFFLTIPPAGGRFEGTGSQTEEVDHRTGLGATTALTWALPRVELTVGAESRWDQSHYQNWFTTDREPDSAATLVHARQTSGALFVQSDIDATSRLRLSLGARYDLVDTHSTPEEKLSTSDTHGIASPKLGALFRLTGDFGAYANVSRGFRSTDGVIEDPALPFITAWAYESGIKFDRHDIHGSVAFFRMDVSNEQTFNPLSGASSSGGASRRQGVEIEMQAPIAPTLSFSTDWTFNDARYRRLITQQGDDPSAVDTLSGLRVYNTAQYVGIASLQLAPRATSWRLRVSTNVVGPYSPFDEPGVVLPAYGLVHLGALVQIGVAQLEVGVRNVLDKAYPELVAGHVVSPGQPRSFYGTVHYAF
ncbi:MAG TPA: TonB-dependent receptor [Gemmatimonadaceae bacterium]|nr:TonB-dependent receptor [Gemmatimonadaceae bacterium]